MLTGWMADDVRCAEVSCTKQVRRPPMNCGIALRVAPGELTEP